MDVSHEMLVLAQRQTTALKLVNCSFHEGRGEAIPLGDGTCDVVLASLSLMYVLDRSACAREMGRVLRTGGRLVAAVWAGPELCDIVRFQQIAGRFAPAPPASGVCPGALADPSEFVQQLKDSGLDSRVEAETLGFDFDDCLLRVGTRLSPELLPESAQATEGGEGCGASGHVAFRRRATTFSQRNPVHHWSAEMKFYLVLGGIMLITGWQHVSGRVEFAFIFRHGSDA